MFKQFKSNVIYAIGSVANSAALFLLIPYLINNLSVSEYGAWSLLEVGIMLFIMLSLPGLEIALMREYWFINDDEKRTRLSSTLIWFVLAWGSILALIGSGLALLLSQRLNIPGVPGTLILALLAGLLEALVNVFLTVFRIREEAWKFTLISVIRMGIFMGSSIILVWNGMGLTGAIMGRAIAGGLALVLGVIMGYRYFSWTFSWSHLWRMVRYGLPLLPTKGAQYILQASDRYVLNLFTALNVVGIYSFGYKVAAGLDILVVRPFAIDWGARRFKIATYTNAPRHYVRILVGYAGVSLFSALVLLSLVPELYGWIAPETYREGMKVVPIIVAAYVVYGLSYPLNIGIMLRDKTKYAPIIGGIAAAVCLGLNFWLIPNYGMLGAAWATLISYIIWTAGITIVSQYFYRVSYSIREILLLITGTVTGYLGIWWIEQNGLGQSIFLMPFILKVVWLLFIFSSIGISILRIEGIQLPMNCSVKGESKNCSNSVGYFEKSKIRNSRNAHPSKIPPSKTFY
ncbi:MAG: polysaccharide biosynthesis C-terminal domain-containing protein [Chloroflexota bacterium]